MLQRRFPLLSVKRLIETKFLAMCLFTLSEAF